MNTRTLTVSTSSIEELRKAYRRIIRAAARMKVEMNEAGLVIDWKTKREVEKKVQTIIIAEDGEAFPRGTSRCVVEVVDVNLSLPDIGGESGKWTVAGLVALVDHDANSKAGDDNEVFSNFAEVRDGYRNAKLFCEHCRVNRYRVRTLVCREVATGNLKQLGVECAGHYVRDAAAEVAALEFQEFVTNVIEELIEDPEDPGRGGMSRRLFAFDEDEVVAMTLKVIRDGNGYVPSSTETPYGDRIPNPNATWREVLKRLSANDPGEDRPECRKDWLERRPTDEDRETAKKILAWLDAAQPTADNEFLTNLKAAFAPGWVSNKRMGFACCVTRAYDRAMAEAAKLANPPTAMAPEGRVAVKGRILSTKHVPNDFGGAWKMLVELDTRARVYCSVPTGCAGTVGEELHFVATFTRSDKDRFFAFGSRPALYVENAKKPRKAKPTPEPVAELIAAEPVAVAETVPAEEAF